MTAYYNEIDPYAAQWLRNLIAAGHIAPGVVDERSIEDIKPVELMGYTQCHFFAGIGVWSRALRLAGWPDDRPVWTGSCPCQPFSAAGKGGGFDDERHLWPAFHHLIRVCRPPVIFGEQVASKDGLAWLDLVQADLEGEGYASAAADLCAAGVGAPHIRQRLYWVGHHHQGLEGHGGRHKTEVGHGQRSVRSTAETGESCGLADTQCVSNRGQEQAPYHGESQADRSSNWLSGCSGPSSGVGNAGSAGTRRDARAASGAQEGCGGTGVEDGHDGGNRHVSSSPACGVADTVGVQRECESHIGPARICEQNVRQAERRDGLSDMGASTSDASASSPTNGYWRDADWLYCRDGKWRPVEPGTFPLAHGAPARVGRLRAYGNAIVPQVAQTFIEAYL